MLQRLAGRLRWERTDEGIRVVIPPRRSFLTVLYGPVVTAWLVVAAIRYWNLFEEPHEGGAEFTLQLIALGIYAVGFCFAVCWLAWTLTNETVLLMDEEDFKIQRRAVGVELVTRRFATREVNRFRFVAPTPFWLRGHDIDPTSSKIQFQSGGKTHVFGAGVTEEEAFALFDRMLRVYKLPGYIESSNTRSVY